MGVAVAESGRNPRDCTARGFTCQERLLFAWLRSMKSRTIHIATEPPTTAHRSKCASPSSSAAFGTQINHGLGDERVEKRPAHRRGACATLPH